MGNCGLMQPLGRLGSEEQSLPMISAALTQKGSSQENAWKLLTKCCICCLQMSLYLSTLPTVTSSASNWQRLTWNHAHGILGDVVLKLLREEWRMGWDGMMWN